MCDLNTKVPRTRAPMPYLEETDFEIALAPALDYGYGKETRLAWIKKNYRQTFLVNITYESNTSRKVIMVEVSLQDKVTKFSADPCVRMMQACCSSSVPFRIDFDRPIEAARPSREWIQVLEEHIVQKINGYIECANA